MNNRFVYAVCIVGHLLMIAPLQCSVPVFENIALTAESAAGGDGSITVTAQGANPLIFVLDPFAPDQQINTTGVFKGVIAGDHSVAIVDSITGTMETALVSISQQVPLMIKTVTVQNVAVAGQDTGAITLVFTGGLGTISVTINGVVASTTSKNKVGDEAVTFVNLAAGIYVITAQSQDGSLPISITIPIVEP